MKKTVLFLTAVLMAIFMSTAKNTYTYKLVKSSNVPDASNLYVYPNASNLYYFKILLDNYNGFAKGKFTIELENAKFTDGTTKLENLYEGYPFQVVYDDVLNQNGIVKITKAEVINASADSLIKGSPTQLSYQIASLKGQTPSMTVSANPIIGSKQTITAQIYGDVIYPGIYINNGSGGSTNKTAEYYEWTLPQNWSAVGQIGSTFILGANQKSISITSDYVTSGEVKVRALNGTKTAGSETKTILLDRGFTFTNNPTSIVFGDNAAKTFSTTLFNGITYEWSVPAGWQINGQGNSLEAVNLNSVSITPEFCNQSDNKVKVRLKKDGEVSNWYEPTTYQGVLQPIIANSTSTIYQYENAFFSISNIFASSINSVSWSGDGVYISTNNGINSKLAFAKSGIIRVYATILLQGCSTPTIIYKDITVNANRLSLSGNPTLCSQDNYLINNLTIDNLVSWNKYPDNLVSIQQNETSCTLSKISNGKMTLSATINNVVTLTKEISVGSPSWVITSSYSNLNDDNYANNFRIFPASGNYAYEGSLVASDYEGIATNFEWSFYSNINRKNIAYWWASGNTVNVGAKTNNSGIVLQCIASNGCGYSYTALYTFYTGTTTQPPLPLKVSISPNPVTAEANIVVLEDTLSETTSKINVSDCDITIFNNYGMPIYRKKTKDKNTKVNVSGWQKGFYVVKIVSKNEIVEDKLYVQ